MATPIDVVAICPTGNRLNRALFTWQKKNKISAASQTVAYCADRAQNLPGPAPNNMLTVLEISSKSVYFRRSYSRMPEHRFFALVEYFHDLPEAMLFSFWAHVNLPYRVL